MPREKHTSRVSIVWMRKWRPQEVYPVASVVQLVSLGFCSADVLWLNTICVVLFKVGLLIIQWVPKGEDYAPQYPAHPLCGLEFLRAPASHLWAVIPGGEGACQGGRASLQTIWGRWFPERAAEINSNEL